MFDEYYNGVVVGSLLTAFFTLVVLKIRSFLEEFDRINNPPQTQKGVNSQQIDSNSPMMSNSEIPTNVVPGGLNDFMDYSMKELFRPGGSGPNIIQVVKGILDNNTNHDSKHSNLPTSSPSQIVASETKKDIDDAFSDDSTSEINENKEKK